MLLKTAKRLQYELKRLAIMPYLALMPRRSFKFQGKTYPYFIVSKNWNTERIIEIPVVYDFLRNVKEKRILEIGNVLSHYLPCKHVVVDKYEKSRGVINQDIIDFKPKQKFDLIVSISTLEHVGWDERLREPEKVLKAIKAIKQNCLAKNGIFVITWPLGYNLFLDKAFKEGRIKFSKAYYLKRTGIMSWKESAFDEIKNVKYGRPFPCGNAVVVGIK